jgi:PAS domain S-box-containing protein
MQSNTPPSNPSSDLLKEQLAESEHRFQTIIENAAEGIYITDPATKKIIDTNPAFASIMGYTIEELRGLSVYDFVIDAQANIDQRLQALHASGQPSISERQYRGRDGHVIDVEASVSVIMLEGKEALVTIVHDVTARKSAEAALKSSEQRFRTLFANVPLPSWVFDLETLKFLEVNDAAIALYGYTKEEFLSMRISDLRLKESVSQLSAALGIFETRQFDSSETQHRRKDGTIIDVFVSWHEMYYGGKPAVLVVAQDITEANQSKGELERAKHVAEQASKAKTDFLANMSHEIRTPMNGILGTIGLLMQTSLTDEQREYIETIRVSGDALLNIINDILDFSKIETGKAEVEEHACQIASVIEETSELFALQAEEKGIDLIYWIEPDVPATVLTDVVRVRQILTNLFSNAIKFTGEGEISITVARQSEQNGKIELLFSVHDTGIGIPKERINRLFKPFSQVDTSTTRRFGGTGLGLAISARSVELLGGKIWVDSCIGLGSTFYFTIKTNKVSNEQSIKVLSPIVQEKKYALVVDDHAEGREILSKLIALWGFEVDSADSIDAALQQMTTQHQYELFIIDHGIDANRGSRLIVQIRANTQYHVTPIVAIVSRSKHIDLPATQTAFVTMVTKPIHHQHLYDAIAQALHQQSSLVVEQHSSAPSSQTPHVLFPSMNVLAVEDNLINQKLIVRVLKLSGIVADVADNGREAVELEIQRHYDLIFMDVQMPEMDGYEATERIRAKIPHNQQPIIIAMTAHALQGDREKCIAAGMDDYLSKPVLVEEVKRILSKWAEKTGKKYDVPRI